MSRMAIFTAVSIVFLTVSMVFLILGMVTPPVSESLKLAQTTDYTYGIFGFCSDSGCPAATYPVLFGDVDLDLDWFLSSSMRNTLAKIFIVSPIAGGLSFFCIVFTLIALLVSNLAVQIFSLVFGVLAAVATCLVAVMVVLVFHPHTAWTGWLYVAAGALNILAVPCLILLVKVADTDTNESDVESKDPFDPNTTAFSGGPLLKSQPKPEPKFEFFGPQVHKYTTDEVSSISKDYSYAGTGASGYDVKSSNNSLIDLKPHVANDVTKPESVPGTVTESIADFYRDSVNLNLGPSTPISAKQKMAPNYAPNVAMPSDNNLPYPASVRSSDYLVESGTTRGVFDHHPDVEGHQPFTELGDIALERASLPEHNLDSDDDLNFTSVSQRAPNVMYQQQLPQQQFPQQQFPKQQFAQQPFSQQPFGQQQLPQQQFRPSQPFQQQYPSAMQYQPSSQPSLLYYGSEAPANPIYQKGGYQPLPQSHNFGLLNFGQNYGNYGGAPRPQARATVSENILNNNPDFAVSNTPRRKPGFVPPAKRYGNPMKLSVQSGAASREGPYGAL